MLLEAELIVSQDMMDWETAFGNLMDGYLVRLDENVEHYYLDLGENTMSNYPLMTDMFPFFLDPMDVPEGFWEYWAGRGVVEGATGWQGVMWEIINGNEPTFYIKVEDIDAQSFTLVDGLQYLFNEVEVFLTVPGDYPLGTYMYSGVIYDVYGVPSDPIPVMITFASDIDQQIELQAGWLGISSYIVPEEPNIETVLEGIENQMEIIISFSGFYWPSQNLNLIGDWNTYEGYKIKMNEPALLEMFGFPAETELMMPAGLQYMPMLSPDPLTNQFFADMGDALMFAFNIQEGTVYWPDGGIATLEVLVPGVGYLVRLNESIMVDFAGKETATHTQTVQQVINTSPWNDVANTGIPHIISISAEALEQFLVDDHIGVFTGSGLCAGLAVVQDNKQNLSLVAYGDEMMTTSTDGLIQGEPLNLKVYRPGTGEISDLGATYSPQFNTGVFEHGGVSLITHLKAEALGVGHSGDNQPGVYPNPSEGLFNISLVGIATVNVMDARGNLVYSGQHQGNSVLDLQDLSKGVYYLQAIHANGISTVKLVIK